MRSIDKSKKWIIYLGLAIIILFIAIQFLLWSLSYMERGLIATSLLSALIGFTVFSGSLYLLKISAYIYSIESKTEEEAR